MIADSPLLTVCSVDDEMEEPGMAADTLLGSCRDAAIQRLKADHHNKAIGAAGDSDKIATLALVYVIFREQLDKIWPDHPELEVMQSKPVACFKQADFPPLLPEMEVVPHGQFAL